MLIGNLAALNEKLGPDHFRFATPSEFFQAATQATGIPDLSGEIPSSWANLITSLLGIWPPTVSATDTLLSAEKFAAINDALGYAPYLKERFDALWRKALEAMDHNSYGQGGDIGDARKLGYAQAAALEGGQILRASLRNIAERVEHAAAGGTAIVVFNPLSWTRNDVVRAHVTLYGDIAPGSIADYKQGMRLVDSKGAPVPFAVEQYSENISRALDLLFVARDVPSLGYKTYYLVPAKHPAAFPAVSRVTLDNDNDVKQPKRVVASGAIDSDSFRIIIDRATGLIDVFDKDLNRPVAHGLEIPASEERGGNPLNVVPETGRTLVNVIRAVELDENSPARTVIRIEGEIAGVPVTQRVLLYQGLKRIDLENTVDWKPWRFLRIDQVFPLEQSGSEVRIGVPFGSAASADLMPNAGPRQRDEVPTEVWRQWCQIQDWVSAGTKDWTLTIGADHQFLNVTPTAIRAGMLRGTRFNQLNIVRHGRPFLLQQPAAGKYVFRYTLTSGSGGWASAQSWRTGMAFNAPLIPVESANELGARSLPPERSFCSIEGGNLVVSALKKADNGDGLILRLFDEAGIESESPIQCLRGDRPFQKTNMLENALGTGAETRLRVRPYEISTVRIRLK